MPMSTPSTFHPFPLLPSELRIKVWNFVVSVPRVVTVSCEKEKIRTRRIAKSFVSQTAVPALLHTCRESRHEGLLTYTPAFKTETSPNYIYVSFEHDAIRCADSMLEYVGEEEVKRVQRLILAVQDAAYFAHFYMDVLMRMGKLRDLDLLVLQEPITPWNTERRHVDGITVDFELARERVPDWECPRVRFVERNTGEELGVIPGGAATPEGMEDGDAVE